MFENVHTTENGIEGLDARTERALTEFMTTLGPDLSPDLNTGEFEVVSQSGRSYTVDLNAGSCTCADHQTRGSYCKHARRVALATRAQPIPVDVLAHIDADRDLGVHLAGHPRVVQTAADGSGEPDEKPENCRCTDSGFPCFPCVNAQLAEIPADR